MSMTPKQVGAVVLAKCAANDPWFPNGGEAMCEAWGEVFAHYALELPDLLSGVTKAYIENGSGFKPLPADIVKHARALRRDRAERETAAERRAREDALDAKLEARNVRGLVAGFGKSVR